MKLFGLIGYPLGHSFSKKYFDKKIEDGHLIDCSFELFPLKKIENYLQIKESDSNLQGLAVTIPYKEKIIPFLSSISETAKEIGAVNCIKIDGDITIGYNTDVIGFKKSLAPLLQSHHTMALVLGTGGASKAVQFVLNKMDIPFLLVSRRKMEFAITYDQLDEQIIASHFLIINCTPLGMTPNEDDMPHLPYEYLSSKHLLYDLIYKPEKTKFLQQGEKYGCQIKNGFEMLILQAEENWKIWNS